MKCLLGAIAVSGMSAILSTRRIGMSNWQFWGAMGVIFVSIVAGALP
ncbi:hypothetical protein [Paraburkholderia aspalathi]|nr:hypothetical protein [Paraburkholderia aspalathi]MBK3841738.1 hypothetical protein [Paraburkholderia aspalathi]